MLGAALIASGCSGAEPRSGATGAPSPAGPSALRAPTQPPLRVENSAAGRSGRLIARAVRDLKRGGFWRPLTRHLYKIHLSTRDGSVNIPDDGHLADALLTADIDRRGSGTLCDIRFYPAAVTRDLVRQWEFFEDGRLPRRPPTLRRFWAAILAHELAHCLPHPNPLRQVGEPVARRWERRVLHGAPTPGAGR